MPVSFSLPSNNDLLALYKNELISDTVDNIDIQGIRQDYTDMRFILKSRTARALTQDSIGVRINNDTTNGNYRYMHNNVFNNLVQTFVGDGVDGQVIFAPIPGNTSVANYFGIADLYIPEYYDDNRYKFMQSYSSAHEALNVTNAHSLLAFIIYEVNAAIDRLTFTVASSENFIAGSAFSLYLYGKR